MYARSRTRMLGVAMACLLPLAALTSCGSSDTDKPGAEGKNPELFKLLPADIKKSKKVKVGVSPNSPPLLRADGEKTVGIIPDLAAEVEKLLGVKLELLPMDYAGLQPALTSERIDLNWSVVNDTTERQQIMDFVDFMRSDHGFLVLKGNPKGLKSADDLCGTRAGTVKGGQDQAYLEEQKAKCQASGKKMDLLLYNSRQDIQTAMQSGKVDSFLGILPSHAFQAAAVKNGELFELAPGVYLEGIFGVAVSKKNTGLRDAIQTAIKQLVSDGTYAEVLAKHDAKQYALTEEQILINGVGNGL